MVFTLKSTSKYGTAYYTRPGFKQAIALPGAQFADGKPPATVEVGGDGVAFAEKAVTVRASGIAKALKEASPEVRKQVREAARLAERTALAEAGISL